MPGPTKQTAARQQAPREQAHRAHPAPAGPALDPARPDMAPQETTSLAAPADQFVWLQQAAGNRSVTESVQRDRADAGGDAKAVDRASGNRFEAFMTDYPGLAAAMSFEQLNQWRLMLNGYQHNRDVDAALSAHERNWRKNAWDPTVPFIGDSRYQERHAQIEEGRVGVDERAGRAPLDSTKILSSEVSQLPAWNVAAEKRFREWAVKEFLAQPLVAELTDRREIVSAMEAQAETARAMGRPHANLWWGRYTIENTGGIVTFNDLMKIQSFSDRYRDEVWNGPEVKALRKGLIELRGHIDEMMIEHKDLSDRNRGAEYSGGIRKKVRGAVRHISEGLGAPSALEIAVAKIKADANPDDIDARSEYLMLQAQAGDYPKMLGPDGIWFKPQEQLTAADKFFQDGQIELAAAALQAAEHSSTESTLKFAGYEKRVMSGAGIAVKWLNRAKTAGKIASAFTGASGVVAAAGVAAGYTAAQEGLQEVSTKLLDPSHNIEWKRVAEQSAIDGLMGLFGGLTQGAFTKALGARFGAKIVTEWGVTAATAERALSLAGATTASFYNVPAKIVLEKIIAGKAAPKSFAEVADMVTEEAASAIAMDTLGGFVHAAGAKADDAARKAAGEPGTKPEPAGDQATAAKAEAARDPNADLVAVLAGQAGPAREGPALPPGRAAPGAALAARPVPRPSAEAAALAVKVEPVRAEWASLKTAEARGQRVLDIVYESMASSGMPKPGFKPKQMGGGHLDFPTWEIHFDLEFLSKDNISAEDFAGAVGLMRHEMEHALQWFRMARQEAATSRETPKELAKRLAMPVKEVAAAIEANRGERPAEDMSPGSPAAIATKAHYESVYGAGKAHRDAVLDDLKIKWEAIDTAQANYDAVKKLPPTDPLHQAALREFWTAWENARPTEESYLALPEEVAAYRAGDEVTQAVRERGVIERLERMRYQHEDANRRLQPLRDLQASIEGKPGQMLSVPYQQAFTKALGDWVSTMHAIRKIETELAAVRQKAAP